MENNVVILGITKSTAFILNDEFPTLQKIEVESYTIRYSNSVPLFLKLLFDAPRIFKVIKRENIQLAQIISDHKIDVVISDNRFGMHHKKVTSIYLTHQLHIQAGVFSVIVNKIHRKFMKKFNEVWVPDDENETTSLAGLLSRPIDLPNIKYIGSLSRLAIPQGKSTAFDFVCILSGPEPLRSNLERLLIEKGNQSNLKICIVRGTDKPCESFGHKNVKIIDKPTAQELSHLIFEAKTIVCRSGYSTLMDLHHLQKTNVILVPTPGQTEQVYLANYWKQKFGARVLNQKELQGFKFL